jgi:hypothetical protein
MKIYSKIVWDKDFNILEEVSSEYKGPVAMMMCSSPPPAPARGVGKRKAASQAGRGVLITRRTALGVSGEADDLGTRQSLLQPTTTVATAARNVLRLLGGGY